MGSDRKPKTFIKLPPEEIAYLFVPILSSADNEIRAHTSMFNPKKTDHYYELGSDSIALINEMVARFQRKHDGHKAINYPYYPPPSSNSATPSSSSPNAGSSLKPTTNNNTTSGADSTTAASPSNQSAASEQRTTPASYPYYPPPPPLSINFNNTTT